MGLLAKIGEQEQGHRQMLLLEGITLIGLLVAGGTTLVYFIFLEQKQNRTLTQFFAAFTHDMKNSLASLRLQAESLKEDVKVPEASPTIARLLSDTSRLQVQVENSLFLGQSVAARLFVETLKSDELLATLNDSWPQLKFKCEKKFEIEADRRAVETVLNNLAHNSLVHGQASEVEIKVSESGVNFLEIGFGDDGKGFQGQKEKLGKMHSRHNPSSGSGLGLFIVYELMKQMGGSAEFLPTDLPRGFLVRLRIKGRTV
jgi:signal transduction histidine kinase